MTKLCAPITLIIMVLSTGCTNRVYFGTSTRFALDASSTTAGLGYKAAQFAYIPPKKDGGEYSVLGKSDVDLSITNIVVEEEFATGQAAECAADRDFKINNAEEARTTKGNLVFGAYTSASLIDVNFGSANPFAGASIGYKRETATVIPITEDGLLRSVYAKSNISSLDYSTTETNGSKTGGVRFRQIFATGKAAVMVARDKLPSIAATSGATACNPQ